MQILTSVLLLLLVMTSCVEEDEGVSLLSPIDCTVLAEGLIFAEEAAIRSEIDTLCAYYPARPTPQDERGHQLNLDSIIMALNTYCPSLQAEFGCYACFESLPPLSMIFFTLDSANHEVRRRIRLVTPADDFMRLR